MKITQKTINIETGQEIIVEIDETPEDRKARLDLEKAHAARIAAEEVNVKEKAALLTRLGITDAEAKLLLS